MRRAVLTRYETSDEGTFGKIEIDGAWFYTLELPDRNNRPNDSRIPAGVYDVVWSFSPHFKKFMYLVLDVPRRSGIRIHSATFAGDKDKGFKKQLNGCLALGEKLGRMAGQKALFLSKPAVRRFESLMKQENFELEIR